MVLVSGTGTNLQALLQACADASYGASVVAVGSDKPGVRGLERAADAGVPAFVVPVEDYAGREAWDLALADAVEAHAPDLVVCAGFMRILGKAFLDRFSPRIVNTHPALLPAFPGAHGVRDALAYGVKVTGATVHLVDAGVDTGPVVAQRCVEVREDDDEASLHERIKTIEREMLVDAVRGLARGFTVDGRKVHLS